MIRKRLAGVCVAAALMGNASSCSEQDEALYAQRFQAQQAAQPR